MPITLSRSMMCFAFLALVALVGCGGDGKFRVDGTATWNGQPIEKGYVELQPVGTGHFSSAEIVNGKFSLETSPGARLVKVTAEKKVGEIPPSERIPVAEPIMFQFLPEEFNSKSTLEMEISSSDPTLNIELTGDELKPRNGLTAEEKARMNLKVPGRR